MRLGEKKKNLDDTTESSVMLSTQNLVASQPENVSTYWFDLRGGKKDVITHMQLLQTDGGKRKETREELAVLWHGSEREIFRKEELSV